MAIDKTRKMKTSSKIIGLSSEDFETKNPTKPQEQKKVKKYKPVKCCFYLTHDLYISVDLISKFNGVSKSKIFNQVLEEYIQRDESQENIKKQKQLDDMKKGL